MNTEQKIEQCLRAAPKPPVSDSLVNRLRNDIQLRKPAARRSAVRRWFAPAGAGVSRWRVAAAAVIALIVLLPLSYGATQLIRGFVAIRQLPAIKLDFDSGALSPDGRHFAGITGDSELYVIDTSTGAQRKLAEKCYGSVVWSADGSEIAVTVLGSAGGQNTLLAVSFKTGKTRILMREEQGWLELVDWSPDGKFLSAARATKPSDASVVLVNLESKEETVLAEGSASPRFSPNGDCISYATKNAGRSVLHLRKVDGTSEVGYSDFPGDISEPRWSPDGSAVIFTGTQKGVGRQHKDVWALRIEDHRFVGTPLPVIPDVEQMQFYNWSHNGQLAYRTGFQLGGIFTLPVALQTGTATGAPRQLVRIGNVPRCFCWSPDGKQMALCQEGGGFSFLSAGTGEKIRDLSVAAFQTTGRGMSWSPDGKWIAHAGMDQEKKGGVFLISVETGEAKRLVPLEQAAYSLTWSADGKSLAYAYNGHIYVVNVEDGQPRQITAPTAPGENKKAPSYFRPVFAPDGKSVAYMTDGGRRILATTVDGRETRQIFEWEHEKSVINVFDWSPDGRHIVFTPGNKEIWCAPTNGDEPFRIADLSNLGEGVWAWWPEWSPKGDTISFGVVHEEHQYWVMENFLPAAQERR
jgi:Tol biopolymer transport system component